jgi:gliding motility-associated-like protein
MENNFVRTVKLSLIMYCLKNAKVFFSFFSFVYSIFCCFNIYSQTTYTVPGTYQWTVPPCVTQVTIKVWGGGGGGGGAISIMRTANDSEACSGGGGGGGGGYSSSTFSVIPGQTYTVVVGAGGTGGSGGAGTWNGGITTQPSAGGTGGTSSFSGNSVNILATGGTGGGGAGSYNNNNTNDVNSMGTASTGGMGSGGTINYAGGSGAAGYILNFSTDKSGAGGGAAGPGGNGGSATHNASVANPPGGTGQGPGGNGANGRYWNVPGDGGYNGNAGTAYGGAGSGAIAHRHAYGVTKYDGGAGAPGAVIIEYTTGALPNPPTASPYSFCGSATISNLTASGTNLQWYDQATGGTPLAPNTPLVAGTTYYVSQTVDGCESNRTPVTVTSNNPPAPTASNQSFCSVAGLTIADLTPTGAGIQWYSQSTGGTPLAATTPLTPNTTYYVSQTMSGCESNRTSVLVTENTPAPPVASNQSFCDGEIATIADLTPTGPGIQWYSQPTGGTALAATTSLVANTTYYVSQTVNGCESGRTSIQVTFHNNPVANAGTDVAINCAMTTQIGDDPTATYTYTWTPSETLNNPTISNPEANPGTTTTYMVTVLDNTTGCSSTDQVLVTVNNANTPTFTNPGPVCSGTAFTLPTTSNNGVNGTWSPAINTTTTTTYTFTPAVAGCTPPVTMTVVVDNQITPTFTNPGPVCLGTVFTLPNTSDNSVSGTWSPAIDNTVTTTYTFTPTTSGCAVPATMTVIVDNQITPTFTNPGPVCSGTNFTLPTTSDNGVVGTWSPVIDNTATTTYTFTPTVSGCSAPVTMTVVVDNQITPAFTNPGPVCSGTNFTLPTISDNGVAGTWSPAVNNTATTTYTFTPTVSGCAAPVTMTVVVDNQITPTFTNPGPVCSGTAFTLPITSNNGVAGTWSPALNNTITTTYTFTPTVSGCSVPVTMTVVIDNQITPTFINPGPVCSGTAFILPTTSDNGVAGTWSPVVNNTATTTYTFTPTVSGCAAPVTMTVVVNNQLTPTFTNPGPVCSGTAFTLPTTSNNAVTGTWSPAINNTTTTTYTFTPSSGSCVSPVTMTVVVNNNISVVVSGGNDICQGADEPVIVLTGSGGTAPYSFTYSVGNGAPQTVNASGSSISIDLANYSGFNANQPGCYDVTAVGSSVGGCLSSPVLLDDYICVHANPEAAFTTSSFDQNNTVIMSNHSTGATSYVWTFGDGVTDYTVNPMHTFQSGSGNYSIELIAYNAAGCSDTAITIVHVEEELIFYVPNTFTPDGDEYNNEFRPVMTSGLDKTSYQLDIYNRWGENIFTTNDIEIGWDGTYKGLLVQDGVYTWKLSFKIRANDERKEFVGHINKIR